MINFSKERQTFSPKLYIKKIPFHLDTRAISRVRTTGQFLGVALLTAFVTYTFLNNITPFGITVFATLQENNERISDLGPKNRVTTEIISGEKLTKLNHDLIYFSTEMPFQFDQATVKLTFQNSAPDQTVSLGFQDQENWHYATKPFDIPLLNSLSWNHTGKNPVLYQKEQIFESVDNFFADLPKNAFIGTYEYELDETKASSIKLADYAPQSQGTIIDTPLRGRHVFYTYLENEPFTFTIEKQDLNWYEDPDPMIVKIYKDAALVFQATAEDDGITDNSRKSQTPQMIQIKNPGPDLPESGVYKIIIDANTDTVIKRISTNLHKIVLQGPLFPAGNHEVYPTVVDQTIPTNLYTNALTLSAITYHTAGRQTILAGEKAIPLDTIKTDHLFTPKETFTNVTLPKNDIVLNGFQGYFAFSENQFFLPANYHTVPITKKEDLQLVDYVVADYTPSQSTGAWKTNERTFNLENAFIKDGRLKWLIKAPKLQENNHTLIIKDIEITFHKKPWL